MERDKYCLEMEKRKCVLCQAEGGILNRLVEGCVATHRKFIQVEKVVSGKINVKAEEWLEI